MGSNFLMLPMIIFYMNDSMVGLWYVFASIGTIATLFDFGFSVTFARNITYCWSGANKLKKEDVEFIENKEIRAVAHKKNDKSLFFIVIPSFQYEILIVSWKIAKK